MQVNIKDYREGHQGGEHELPWTGTTYIYIGGKFSLKILGPGALSALVV